MIGSGRIFLGPDHQARPLARRFVHRKCRSLRGYVAGAETLGQAIKRRSISGQLGQGNQFRTRSRAAKRPSLLGVWENLRGGHTGLHYMLLRVRGELFFSQLHFFLSETGKVSPSIPLNPDGIRDQRVDPEITRTITILRLLLWGSPVNLGSGQFCPQLFQLLFKAPSSGSGSLSAPLPQPYPQAPVSGL